MANAARSGSSRRQVDHEFRRLRIPRHNNRVHTPSTERLLALCGYSENPEYFKRSLREFIGRGTGDPGNSN